MKQGFIALILAAGQGTRFKSEKIKVLHRLMGKSMLQLVVDSIQKLKPEKIYVVVGYQKDQVMKEIVSPKVSFVHQQKQLGTAHAALAAKHVLKKEEGKDMLVINGDMPLVTAATLRPLFSFHRRQKNVLTLLSAVLENPRGFGRLIRSGNKIARIVEEQEATPSQRRIKEVNAGVYISRVKDFFQALSQVSNLNRKGEYYLPDVVEIFSQQGKKIGVYKTSRLDEIGAVNSRLELAMAVDTLRKRKIQQLIEKGITFYDPQTTWIDLDAKIGRDTILYASVIIQGKSRIGNGCQLFPFVHLMNSRVGNRVRIFGSSMIEESVIEDDSQVGPFAHLRPKTIVKSGSKVGNFVELKKTVFGPRSKAAHLSYIGDCEVEEGVNIGAGTIVCNYDGRKKHKTHIEAGAFIGSGTELVAPIRIGKNAYIGAGSTITKDVRPGALAVERGKQKEKPGWAKRIKKK
ncbi:MAG: bifunctional UDP-N-acetylglucosamine diphosphorylase/glucosamine-1-phosphate N-acetyltransferase GlmU [Candidatus Aminicenantes bacterium]|nr:bifunctional UDP-N-acetylglucosamine diphosphorylase/glucosamine-1-phosphate N-acetyltransferase GlmU [Candidatus Aminicenantes bacterium]